MPIPTGATRTAIAVALVLLLPFQPAPVPSVAAAEATNSFATDEASGPSISGSAGELPSGSCTATWTAIEAEVEAGKAWNVATGAPHPAVYTLSQGCVYDAATPANTPIVLPPSEMLPWAVLVDGVPIFVTNYNPSTGEIQLVTDAGVGARVEIEFFFEGGAQPVPVPPPVTPIPVGGGVGLVLLAAVSSIALWWRLRPRADWRPGRKPY